MLKDGREGIDDVTCDHSRVLQREHVEDRDFGDVGAREDYRSFVCELVPNRDGVREKKRTDVSKCSRHVLNGSVGLVVAGMSQLNEDGSVQLNPFRVKASCPEER